MFCAFTSIVTYSGIYLESILEGHGNMAKRLNVIFNHSFVMLLIHELAITDIQIQLDLNSHINIPNKCFHKYILATKILHII